MKKTIVALVCCFGLVLGFVACGDDDDNGGDTIDISGIACGSGKTLKDYPNCEKYANSVYNCCKKPAGASAAACKTALENAMTSMCSSATTGLDTACDAANKAFKCTY